MSTLPLLSAHNLLFAIVAAVVVVKVLYVLAVWMYNGTTLHDLKVSTHSLRLRLKSDYAQRQLAEEDHKRMSRERRDIACEVAAKQASAAAKLRDERERLEEESITPPTPMHSVTSSIHAGVVEGTPAPSAGSGSGAGSSARRAA